MTVDSIFPDPAVLLEALPIPILVLDEMGHIRFANAAAQDFFETGKPALLRSRFSDFTPFASPALTAIAEVRRSGGTLNEHAVSVGTPRAGGERHVDIQVSVIEDTPQFVAIVLFSRSMAQKIDQQLTHRGAARSVTGLASMLAHEIKNPLSGIRGAAQLIEPALSGEDRALARLICNESDRIRDLVDRMEVFSDERPPERKPVNIHAVLDHVKALIVSASGQGLTIREEYDPSLPPVVGSRDQLVQAFLNLLKNAAEAIEATQRTGEIVLSTAFRPGVRLTIAASGEKVSLPLEVRVRDTGGGIPDDIRPHVFEPFVTTKVGGRGLGLALVAKIIKDHGGMVECEADGRGTLFRVLLPMMKEAAGPRALPEEALV
jgi:two-component system, NtrC family, nitrogen regulation sensor histidine kinase GlnL